MFSVRSQLISVLFKQKAEWLNVTHSACEWGPRRLRPLNWDITNRSNGEGSNPNKSYRHLVQRSGTLVHRDKDRPPFEGLGELQSYLCFSVHVNALRQSSHLSWTNSAISFCICFPFSCFCRRTSKPATEVVPWGSFLSVCRGRRDRCSKKKKNQQWTSKQTMAAFLRDLFVVWV